MGPPIGRNDDASTQFTNEKYTRKNILALTLYREIFSKLVASLSSNYYVIRYILRCGVVHNGRNFSRFFSLYATALCTRVANLTRSAIFTRHPNEILAARQEDAR